MELRITPATLPTSPTFNFEELKAIVQEKSDLYSRTVYDIETQGAEMKADRAGLNRLVKALNDARIKQERAYMEPLMPFKAQIMELIDIIKPAIAAIDKQVKQADEQRKEAKLNQIKQYWGTLNLPYPVQLEQIMDTKWLNASVSMATIEKAITDRLDAIAADVATIRKLPEFAFEAECVYMSTLDIRKALDEAHKLSEMAKRKAEQTAIVPAQTEPTAATATPEPTEADKPEETRYWLSFRANLTLDDARALKVFFDQRGIEYDAIH